jgi:hypothetical protein
MACVNQSNGKVFFKRRGLFLTVFFYFANPSFYDDDDKVEKLTCLGQWQRNYTIETVLAELRKYVLVMIMMRIFLDLNGVCNCLII